MKKSIFQKAAVVSLLGISSLSVFPPQSQAIIGAATGGVSLLVVGGIMFGTGALLLTGGVAFQSNGLGFLGLGSGLIGLILLDDKGQVSPQFTQLSAEQAKALSISSDEKDAYNSELPQINALYQTIVSETQKQNQADTSTNDLAKFANQEWATYGEQSLSSNAQSALEKVRSNIAQQFNQAATQISKRN